MYPKTAFPSIDMKRTGKAIEQTRKARGLTVRELQEYFGFAHPQAIYKWQWGETLPSVDNLFALARILQVNMEDLLVECDREVLPFSGKHIPEFSRRAGSYSADIPDRSRRISTESPWCPAAAAMFFAICMERLRRITIFWWASF